MPFGPYTKSSTGEARPERTGRLLIGIEEADAAAQAASGSTAGPLKVQVSPA